RHRLAVFDDEVAEGDAVGRDQPAGTSGDLHGGRLRVAGAEGLHDAVATQRVGDDVGRTGHVGGFGRGHAVDGLADPFEIGGRADPAVHVVHRCSFVFPSDARCELTACAVKVRATPVAS